MGFRQRVPERHVDDAHRDGALPVTAGFFVAHAHRPCPVGIDEAVLALDFLGLGGEETWQEPLAQKTCGA